MKDKPNEGINKPIVLVLKDATKGDSVTIGAACTLTYLGYDGKDLVIEVSDPKFDEPPELEDIPPLTAEEYDHYMSLPDKGA